ncbi:MAG TPA: sulfite exporter TauE/SafE family protein [Actinomycetales bacterium]|nr:sulfite exporter TauE/SafE family protein [Actinomycetales bacterium]
MIEIALGAFVIATVAAFAQSVSGFGSALVAVPLLSLLAGPRTAVVTITVLSIAMTGLATARERRHVEWHVAGTLALTGLLGMPVGLVLLTALEPRTLTLVIAVLVLAFALLLASGWAPHPGPWARRASGVVSGAMLTSTGMNGPPLVITLQAMRLRADRFRATLQAAFCTQDVAAVLGFVVVGQVNRTVLVAVAAGLPGLPLGWLLGDRVFTALSASVFRKVVLGMLVASAAAAGGSALTG